ncbi:glycosyltransferase [Sphingomonas sp. ac-8]|uniref:glycosyltransferase n=1 Tax=Sphingomonas sp. ac-8 TaxID=3242977 RepID=UPI003A7FD7BE
MPLADPVAVAVPVRDEAALLPGLLDALARQTGAPAFTLCLFFDNCRDASAERVASLADGLPYPIRSARCDRGGEPNAGLARRQAMALAETVARDGILLTTDADGAPAPDWIAANLSALKAADVVAGRILRQPGAPSAMQDRLEAYYDRLHALRRSLDPVPWDAHPGHHWTSGASLAMRAASYRRLGGFAAVPSGEDAALGDAAARAGLRVRRDAAVVVHTSARRAGRAGGGLATTLAAFDAAGGMPTVAHPDDEAWRYRMHAHARLLHGTGGYDALAAELRLPLAEVDQVAAECRNGEAFAARIVGAPPGGMRAVGLGHAERAIAALEQSGWRGAA